MNRKIAFLLLVFGVFSEGAKRKHKHQKQTSSEQRIINGVGTNIIYHRHFVVVSNPDDILCGGALVTSNKVLTAAHCIVGVKNPLYIYPGITSRREIQQNAKRYESFKQSVHERYQRKGYICDLAVVYLTENVLFTDKIFPIHIAANPPPIGAKITIVGHGIIDCSEIVNGSCKNVLADRLMQTEMTIFKVQDPQIIVYMTPNRPCKGDSGGPYTYNGKLVALESHSDGDNCNGAYNYECSTSGPIMLEFLGRHGIYPAN